MIPPPLHWHIPTDNSSTVFIRRQQADFKERNESHSQLRQHLRIIINYIIYYSISILYNP
jgi:hypothetical protein